MDNLLDLSKHFNWIDILVFLLFLRVIFVSLKNGLQVEFFKVLGTFFATFAALHYYSPLANVLVVRAGSKNPPGAFVSFLSFVLIAVSVYAFFWLLRLVVSRYAEVTLEPAFNRWMGLLGGCVRALLLTSIVLFALLTLQTPYLKKSVFFSYTGSQCATVAPATYTWFLKSIVAKFAPGSTSNAAVSEVLRSTPKKK